jgi:hypothetical protein
MEIPKCANNLAGTCERSDTIVEAEKQNCFVIRCRTCKGINIWPRDDQERHDKYQGFLMKMAKQEQKNKLLERKREYSFGGVK